MVEWRKNSSETGGACIQTDGAHIAEIRLARMKRHMILPDTVMLMASHNRLARLTPAANRPLATRRTGVTHAAMEPDLVAPRNRLAYYDRQTLILPHPMTSLDVWRRMMARPLPLIGAAFAIRDAIAARFGVKRIGGFSGRAVAEVRRGDTLDFFLVEKITPTELTLTERDRHLDVMISVTVTGCDLAITASVITHNAFGRAYMLPVAPAHKLIVWAMLRRLKKELVALEKARIQ